MSAHTVARSVRRTGPLADLRVVEFAGLGPPTFAAMMLADMGAEVVRVERPGHQRIEAGAVMRGRTIVELDLRDTEGLSSALELVLQADVLIEGFRPGVMERLGLGPEAVLRRNKKLVYGRVTGWGQDGPRAATAGHDIDYIAITGALHAIGTSEEPIVPLNLLGDYGGGALYLVSGILAAVIHAQATGQGQVIDCAICDGTLSLLSPMTAMLQAGRWQDRRQSNFLDGAAPYYRPYRCADGQFIAVGAIEPQFFAVLTKGLELDQDPLFEVQGDPGRWPAQRERLAQVFGSRPRSEWLGIFDHTDACVAPVHSLLESEEDPHLVARGAFVTVDGKRQAAPAPRFSRTAAQARPQQVGEAGEVIARWCSHMPTHGSIPHPHTGDTP